MKKFILGLSAFVAVLLPLSQNAQAHWVYYRKFMCTATFMCTITLTGITGIMAIGSN